MSAAATTAALHQLPPSYSGFSNEGINTTAAVNINTSSSLDEHELPAYTPGRMTGLSRAAASVISQQQPKEFYYEIKKKGKPFATLTIIAEDSYSKNMPTIVEGAPIKGRVRLSLERPDAIQSVVVSVSTFNLVLHLPLPSQRMRLIRCPLTICIIELQSN